MMRLDMPKEKPAGAGTPNGFNNQTTSLNANIATPIGDVNEKLSIAFAVEQGYRILLGGDGEAEISSPCGKTYYVSDFECDCPDKRQRGGSHRGRCKHEIWVSQLRPCEMCGAVMELTAFRTCFGEAGARFECPICANAWQLGMVRAQRRMNRTTGERCDKLTVEGRCRQAMSWMKGRNGAYYVLQLLEQSPHLAAAMVRELAACGEGKLADDIAKKYGLDGERRMA